MRFSLTPELEAFITERVTRYEAEATETYHVLEAPKVAQFRALPLIRHWFEMIAIQADGEIVKWSTDEPGFTGVQFVEDRYDWLSALVEGTLRYSELRLLLPVRPPSAADCLCVGKPLFARGKFICPECCGLGWVQVERCPAEVGDLAPRQIDLESLE